MAEENGKKKTGGILSFTQLWLALLTGVIFVGLSLVDGYEQIELKTYDLRFTLRNELFEPPVQMPVLATVDIDDESVDQEGRFEDWDRTYHARVLDIVGALGARSVGVDFLLPEASTPMVREEQVLGADVNTREDILSLFRNPDHIFADVCRERGNIYFAQYLTEAGVQNYDWAQQNMPQRTPEQENRFRMLEPYTLPLDQEFMKSFYIGMGVWPPVDTLLATARGVGQVQPIPDMDGIVRRNRALYVYDGRVFPALSLVMVCDYLSVPVQHMQIHENEIVIPGARVPGEQGTRDIHVPIDDKGSILINWAGDYRSTYRHYPYISIKAFWENYQLDRLSQSVKTRFTSDPNLLTGMLEGAVDVKQLTTQMMLEQAGLGQVDALVAVQNIAAAVRMDRYVREGTGFDQTVTAAFGRRPAALPNAAQLRAVYNQLATNWRVNSLLAENRTITASEVSRGLGIGFTDANGVLGRLKPLLERTTGRISPRQYPLWFFTRRSDGTPVSTRDVLNTRFAQTVKQHLRTHAEDVDQVVSSFLTPTAENYVHTTDLTVRLIARSRSFPEQDYSLVPEEMALAAMVEMLITEGLTRDDFVGMYGDSFAPLYERLSRNLMLEQALNGNPNLELGVAVDSLCALRQAALLARSPELTPAQAESLTAVRPRDIEGDFHVLRHIVAEAPDNQIPVEAHPLVFYTTVVDGEPVFVSDFNDAVIFYGITSTGGHDRNPTPFEPRYPMVGMHLNLFNQIVTGQFLHRPSPWLNWLIIIGLALMIGLIIPKLSPTLGGVVMTVSLIGYAVFAVLLFVKAGWWIDTVGPLGAVVFSYLSITVRNYIVEEREKKFIKGAFASYLAPEVVNQIAENPEGLRLGGEPVVMTAFFSDIQKFSTISQALTATQLVELLNDYLTEMTDITFKYQGTVDKFEGDAIVAFFGAPIRFSDHAVRACLASIEMQHKLAELRPKYKDVWGHNVFQRIGLNSGEMVVGNMGSRNRFDYTMMGDNVNLAARLEESAKQYRIYSQISDSTYQDAKDFIEVRELDKTVVVGRSEPVTVYELLDKKGDLSSEKQNVVTNYHDGLGLYREQRWEEAIAKFNDAIASDPDNGDPTSEILIARCESILSGDVQIPKDWDGVWVLTEK